MQENYTTTENVIKLAGTHLRQNVIDFAIARLAMETDSVQLNYYGNYENTADLQPLVETLRGLSTEHRLELILLINTKTSINEYGLSHSLVHFCKTVSEPYEKIVFSFLFTFFVSLEIAFRNPAKEIIFEATESRVVELAEVYKFYLGLKNFHVKLIKGFDDFSRGISDEENVLGICIPPYGARGFYVVGPQELPVKNLDAAVVLTAAMERSHPYIIMAVDSFLFNKGKMAEARGFLLETGRLSGVISLATNESFERSSIGANLVLISPKREKNIDIPIYFSSTRHGYDSNLLDHKEVANLLLSEKEGIQNKDNFDGEWVTLADLENNNYILSPDRYLGSENLTLLETFYDNYITTSLDNLVEIIRPIPLKSVDPDKADYQVNEVMIGDLKMAEIITLHRFGRDYKRIFLDLKTYMRAKAQIIQPGDILFSIKATIGKVSLVDKFIFELPKNTFFTANQNMLIFRMRKNSEISPQALLCFLSNDVVNYHFDSLSTGSTLKNLPINYLRELEVPIPGSAIQEEIKANFKEQEIIRGEIQELHEDLHDLQKKIWPEEDLAFK